MIGIVGGGIAGLAAAHRLQDAGKNVKIFESQSTVGGLAMSYETAGDPIEVYYHHLLKSETAILDLIDEFGLQESVEWRVGTTGYYIEGTEHPLNTPLDILSYPHLGVYDTFRLGLLTLGKQIGASFPPLRSYDDFETYDDVPIREFIIKNTTKRVYENFWEPLLDAKFGNRKDDISAAWLLGRIQFRSERDLLRGEILGYLDGGFERLIGTLHESVGEENIHLGARVEEIETANGNVDALTVTEDGMTNRYDVDDVVVATMPHVLESLIDYSCPIEFQGSICSVVSLEESVLDNYWVNIADDVSFGALIEHTNFIPAERYGGEHLLYVARYVQGPEEEIWQLEDGEIEDRWLSEIESLYPSFDRTTVNWIQTSRNPMTAPVYKQNYIEDIVPYQLSEVVAEGLYYAGMATRAQYPDRSLSGAIEAGFDCASRIIEN